MERLMIKLSVFVLLLAICIFAFLPSGNPRVYKRMKRATRYTGSRYSGSYYGGSYYGRSYYGSSYYGGSYYGGSYYGSSSVGLLSWQIGVLIGSIGLVVTIVGIVLCVKYCKHGQRQNRVTVLQAGQLQRQGPPPQGTIHGPPPAYPGPQQYPQPPQYSVQAGPANNQVQPNPAPYPPPNGPGVVDAAYPPKY